MSSPSVYVTSALGYWQPVLISEDVRLGEPRSTLKMPGPPRNAAEACQPDIGLYSGTEDAVRCDGAISDYFPVYTEVRQGFVLAPTLFNACIDHVGSRRSRAAECRSE